MNRCSEGQYPEPGVWVVCYGVEPEFDGPFLATTYVERNKLRWIDPDGNDVTGLAEYWQEVPTP